LDRPWGRGTKSDDEAFKFKTEGWWDQIIEADRLIGQVMVYLGKTVISVEDNCGGFLVNGSIMIRVLGVIGMWNLGLDILTRMREMICLSK
jgi:hypothetical protein